MVMPLESAEASMVSDSVMSRSPRVLEKLRLAHYCPVKNFKNCLK